MPVNLPSIEERTCVKYCRVMSCGGLHIFYVVGYSSDWVFLNWAVFIHVINLITVCSLIENSSCDRGGLDKIYTFNNVIETILELGLCQLLICFYVFRRHS